MVFLDRVERLLLGPVVHDLIKVVIKAFVNRVNLSFHTVFLLAGDQALSSLLEPDAGIPERVRDARLQHIVALGSLDPVKEHGEESKHLLVRQVLQFTAEHELGQKNGVVRSDDAGNFSLEEHVLVFVDEVVLGEHLVLGFEVRLLFVAFGCQDGLALGQLSFDGFSQAML